MGINSRFPAQIVGLTNIMEKVFAVRTASLAIYTEKAHLFTPMLHK